MILYSPGKYVRKGTSRTKYRYIFAKAYTTNPMKFMVKIDSSKNKNNNSIHFLLFITNFLFVSK